MISVALVLSLSLLEGAPQKARAPQSPPPPESSEADNTKRAKELFQWAQRLYKQARYAESIAKFEEAYAARPHPVIYFNIGKCHEQLGETGKALRAYRDYLRLMPMAPDREVVSDAIANLERRLKERGVQQLLVFADPSEARIEVDGKELGSSPASIELVAGNHMLAVRAQGYEPVERSFVMSTTHSMEMTIALRPEAKAVQVVQPTPQPAQTVESAPPPPPPPPPMVDLPIKDEKRDEKVALAPPSQKAEPAHVSKEVVPAAPAKRGRAWTWVAGGVGVAAAGGGVGLMFAAQGAADQFRNSPPTRTQAQANEYVARVQGLSTGSRISYGVAAGALVTAVVLFFVEGS